MSSKKAVTFLRVSSIVLSFLKDKRSIADEVLSNGFRKSMQSMNPPDGNESSNIMMSLISSVRSRRFLICDALFEKVSVAARSVAYTVEHLSDMICLIRSNPIFCSNLTSIPAISYPSDSPNRSLSSLMLLICFTCPALTNAIFPVSSETTITSASVSSVIPIAALCLIP